MDTVPEKLVQLYKSEITAGKAHFKSPVDAFKISPLFPLINKMKNVIQYSIVKKVKKKQKKVTIMQDQSDDGGGAGEEKAQSDHDTKPLELQPIRKQSSQGNAVENKLVAVVDQSKKVSACLICSQVLKLYKMRPQAHLLRQEEIKEELQEWTKTFEHCSQQFDKFDNDDQIQRMSLLRTTVQSEWTVSDVEFVLGIYSRIVSENKKGKDNLEKIKKFTLNKLTEDSFIGGKGKLTFSY